MDEEVEVDVEMEEEARRKRHFTQQEDDQIRQLRAVGTAWKEVALSLDRTISSVSARFYSYLRPEVDEADEAEGVGSTLLMASRAHHDRLVDRVLKLPGAAAAGFQVDSLFDNHRGQKFPRWYSPQGAEIKTKKLAQKKAAKVLGAQMPPSTPIKFLRSEAQEMQLEAHGWELKTRPSGSKVWRRVSDGRTEECAGSAYKQLQLSECLPLRFSQRLGLEPGPPPGAGAVARSPSPASPSVPSLARRRKRTRAPAVIVADEQELTAARALAGRERGARRAARQAVQEEMEREEEEREQVEQDREQAREGGQEQEQAQEEQSPTGRGEERMVGRGEERMVGRGEERMQQDQVAPQLGEPIGVAHAVAAGSIEDRLSEQEMRLFGQVQSGSLQQRSLAIRQQIRDLQSDYTTAQQFLNA